MISEYDGFTWRRMSRVRDNSQGSIPCRGYPDPYVHQAPLINGQLLHIIFLPRLLARLNMYEPFGHSEASELQVPGLRGTVVLSSKVVQLMGPEQVWMKCDPSTHNEGMVTPFFQTDLSL